MERKAHKTNENYVKNLSASIWEQDAGSSSLPTRTTFHRKSAYSGGFSAFFILLLRFGRLLFCGGFEAKKWLEYERLEQPNP